MVFGQAQDRIPLCQVRKKQTMRGSRKWIDHAHVRLWTVVVVSLQIGIIGVMVLEGQFHTPAVSAAQTGPGKSTKSSNELSRTRLWANRMSEDAKGTVLKRLNTSDHYHYKKWMDGLLRIPITSLHFHETDGSPLGISADYGVAAKMFKEDRKIADDAVNEMQLQAAVKNPNIIRFLGTVRNSSIEADKTTPAGFVMEYYPGIQLEVILDELSSRSLPPIPRAARYKIALDIANSLAYLHSINIIHFDVKPEQLLIRGFPPDEGPVSARLIDFGMALHHKSTDHHVNAQLEGGNRYRGTQHYLAPELVTMEKNVTEMVDVYSFGVVLWEMYTRGYPYRGYEIKDVMKRIQERNPIGLKLPKDCEHDWKTLVRDCMQWNPEDRPTFKYLSWRLAHILDIVLLEETNGKNNSDSVWLESGFDTQDVVHSSDIGWDMVGVIEDSNQVASQEHVIWNLMDHKETEGTHESTALCPGSAGPANESHRSVLLDAYPIEVTDLEFGKQLGAGIYGEVSLSNLTVRTKIFEEVNSETIREMQVLSTLKHPNIIHFIGAIVNGSFMKSGKSIPLISGIVTEHLGGNAVALEHTSSKTKMSSEVIGVIAAQLASAIAHVHSHGLVLISLSPQNAVIQMGRPGGIPVVKITDVKLAECSKGDWQYNKGVKLRSQGYIAPEVLAGKRPTGKSDTFSLGKIMKFMCRDGRAPSPAPVGCGSKWRTLVARCLLADPSERPDPLAVFNSIQSMGSQQSVEDVE